MKYCGISALNWRRVAVLTDGKRAVEKTMARQARVTRELAMLVSEPPPGISCWAQTPDSIDRLEAVMIGSAGTPYADGAFQLQLAVYLLLPSRRELEVRGLSSCRATPDSAPLPVRAAGGALCDAHLPPEHRQRRPDLPGPSQDDPIGTLLRPGLGVPPPAAAAAASCRCEPSRSL